LPNDMDVLILGAGMAGLTAARALAERGIIRVCVLEVRPRVGGRILSQKVEGGGTVELGAEFVHGRAPELWALIDEVGATTVERHGPMLREPSPGTLVVDDPQDNAMFEPLEQLRILTSSKSSPPKIRPSPTGSPPATSPPTSTAPSPPTSKVSTPPTPIASASVRSASNSAPKTSPKQIAPGISPAGTPSCPTISPPASKSSAATSSSTAKSVASVGPPATSSSIPPAANSPPRDASPRRIRLRRLRHARQRLRSGPAPRTLRPNCHLLARLGRRPLRPRRLQLRPRRRRRCLRGNGRAAS